MGRVASREAQGLANRPPQAAPSLHPLIAGLVYTNRHKGGEDVTDVEVTVILWEEVHMVEGGSLIPLCSLPSAEGGIAYLGWTEMLNAPSPAGRSMPPPARPLFSPFQVPFSCLDSLPTRAGKPRPVHKGTVQRFPPTENFPWIPTPILGRVTIFSLPALPPWPCSGFSRMIPCKRSSEGGRD